MKNTLLSILLLLVSYLAISQAAPGQRTISVSGTAEMEIVPDEIYVDIEIKEYQKKGESKKDLETLKQAFLAAFKASGLPDSILSIKMYSGANNYYQSRKQKNNDLKSSITYRVKFSSSQQMDELIKRLDDDATARFEITETGYSRMPEIKKQLKIKAIQVAKEKAIYLSDAIGEKAGEAITINEFDAPYTFNYEQANLYANNISYRGDSNSTGSDFTKLQFKFSVSVVFALK